MKISNPREIRIEDYNYNLPEDNIAKYPLEKRDSSKLLIYKNNQINDTFFSNLKDFIPANSLMIFNNTRVIQARIHFQKVTGAQIEIFCLEPYSPADYFDNFQQTNQCSWICLVGNLKKWKEGYLVKQFKINDEQIELRAIRKQQIADSYFIEFDWDNSKFTFSEILDVIGELPIPPYLDRDTEEKDKSTYQTVYSKIEGSVAAPTAGLHFTPEVLEALERQNVKIEEVTLHVGAGTFKPVKTELVSDHIMHAEYISVNKETVENLLHNKNKIIAVGTTSVRTLESLYYLGVILQDKSIRELRVHQWMPYADANNLLTIKEALQNILDYLNVNGFDTLTAETQILIIPGYEFKIVDAMITNFHQPKSTLLLLVSAFIGNDKRQNIYQHALDKNYRFLSYGDGSLIFKE